MLLKMFHDKLGFPIAAIASFAGSAQCRSAHSQAHAEQPAYPEARRRKWSRTQSASSMIRRPKRGNFPLPRLLSLLDSCPQWNAKT